MGPLFLALLTSLWLSRVAEAATLHPIVDCTASSSDMRYDGRCQYAYDHDVCTTNWVSTTVAGGDGLGAPDWIRLELGGERIVNAVQLWQRGGNEIRGVRLEFSSGPPVDLQLAATKYFESTIPEHRTSFVKIVTTANSGIGHNGFSNIEFWHETSRSAMGRLADNLPKINIVGCSASSSDMNYDGRCEYAYDDDPCISNWVSTTLVGGDGLGAPDWIQLNFNGAQKVNAVRLWQRGGNEIRGVRLEFSSGSPVEMTLDGSKYGPKDVTFFHEHETTHVKIVVTANTGKGHNGFSDIKFFHDPAVSGEGSMSKTELVAPWPTSSHGSDHGRSLPNYDQVGRSFNVKTMTDTNQLMVLLPSIADVEERRIELNNGIPYAYSKHTEVKQEDFEEKDSSAFSAQSRSAWNMGWAAEVGLATEMNAIAGKVSYGGKAKTSGEVQSALSQGLSVTKMRQVRNSYVIKLLPDVALHPALSQRLDDLNETLNRWPEDFEAELQQLFDEYGTHYTVEIEVGGKIEALITTSSCRADNSLKTEHEVSVEAKKQYAVKSLSASGRVAGNTASETSSSQDASGITSSVSGGDPEMLQSDGFEAWKSTIRWDHRESMVVTGFKLNPLWYKMSRSRWPTLKPRLQEYYLETYLGSGPVSEDAQVSCEKPEASEAIVGHAVSGLVMLFALCAHSGIW